MHGRSRALIFGNRSVFYFGALKFYAIAYEFNGVFVCRFVKRCGVSYVAGYRHDFFIPTFESIGKLSGSLLGRCCALVFGNRSARRFAALKFYALAYEFNGIVFNRVVFRVIRRRARYGEIGNFFAAFCRSVPAVENIGLVLRTRFCRTFGSDCRRAVFHGLSFAHLLAFIHKLYFILVFNRV